MSAEFWAHLHRVCSWGGVCILIWVGVVYCLWAVNVAKRPRSHRDSTHGLGLTSAMLESRTFQTCLVVRITWGAC